MVRVAFVTGKNYISLCIQKKKKNRSVLWNQDTEIVDLDPLLAPLKVNSPYGQRNYIKKTSAQSHSFILQ